MYRIVYIFLVYATYSIGYTQNPIGKPLSVHQAKHPIVLDGLADDADWETADRARGFYLNYPTDTAAAPFQTEVRLVFDEQNLYVFFTCYDDNKPSVVHSLRRDFVTRWNDHVTLLLGSFNDKFNGFFFSITPYNVQREGIINAGGAGDESFSDTWDNKWYSKTVRYDDRWEAELMIPFKSFRYKSSELLWNLNFVRRDIKHNATSSWIATPIQYTAGALAYSGYLKWEDKIPKGGANISLIPYTAAISSVDHEATTDQRDLDTQVGLDAKVSIGPSLNLDITINPDFSQAEVDQQIINLTRFEYRFPERRQFFLENSDLFDRGGFPDTRPFFSRRIGLAYDTLDDLQKVPILYGARVSGSINTKWRISAMNMQTNKSASLGLPTQNYTVATVQHNFWKQSSFSLMYVNKESVGINTKDSLTYFNEDLWQKNDKGHTVLNKYNRTISADMDLLSEDNRWYGSYNYSRSFDPFGTGGQDTWAHYQSYTVRDFDAEFGQIYIHENFNPEAGFTPNKDVYPGLLQSFVGGSFTLYPKNKIVTTGPAANLAVTHIPGGTLTDRVTSLGYYTDFVNTSGFEVEYEHTFQRLTTSFNPIDEDEYESYQENDEHTWGQYRISYRSDTRKIFRYRASVGGGSFYNGNSKTASIGMGYRIQPYVSLGTYILYNDISLPEQYGKAQLFLIRPRINLTFTTNLFLSTVIQYNTLDDNINMNARLQWRYKPASDMFIVYTENYVPNTLGSKNRALVFKLTYWFNY